jgi:hypothetical protein
MTRCALVIPVFAFAAIMGSSAAAQPSPAKNDYSADASWLCRPGRQDACAVDQTTTVVAGSGAMKVEKWTADPQAPIDCFYVYPTVSLDPTGNSDMTAGTEERQVVKVQFARFASQCRVFAPLYRQFTLTALRAATAGKPLPADRSLAGNDVLDAWNYYLAHDNNGRGVVLIGHSQGSFVLMELIRREIDGKPIQSRIVSAILAGANVAVPRGKDVGGAFKNLPLCRSAQQTGCVISYVTFRSTIPPPATSRFGRVDGEGMEAACTNPAALAGGRGELHAHLSASGQFVSVAAETGPWVKGGPAITTPFVSVPGLLSAQCVSNEKGSYLEVTVNGNPSDPRTDDITGDILTNGQVNQAWGLHLIDVHLAMGNLIDIVGQQSRAFRAKRQSSAAR